MNIEEYRAMKAQEAQEQQQKDSQGREEQPNVQAQQTTTVTTEPSVQTEAQTESTQPTGGTEDGTQGAPSGNQESESKETALPTTVEIDGVEVPIEELKKGYLRQSDYTQKTQSLARDREQLKLQEQYFQALNSNPQLAEAFAKHFNLPYVDPTQQQLMEANNKYQDLLLKQEVATLEAKYSDFDVREVMKFAVDNKIENLEYAYTLVQAQKHASTPADGSQETQSQEAPVVDVESLKEQIRQDLLKELQSNVDTQSIIQSGGDTQIVRDNSPVLTQQELKIARNMKLTPEEYAKWRDKK